LRDLKIHGNAEWISLLTNVMQQAWSEHLLACTDQIYSILISRQAFFTFLDIRNFPNTLFQDFSRTVPSKH